MRPHHLSRPAHRRFLVLFLFVQAAGFLTPPGRAFAAEPPPTATVKPLAWLQSQQAPEFAADSTLPPLARWGWSMSWEVAKELADRWGVRCRVRRVCQRESGGRGAGQS